MHAQGRVTEFRFRAKLKVGWGFVPVRATLGKSEWRTTLFPTKAGSYLLAIKAKTRTAEGVGDGDTVTVHIHVL